MILGIFDSGLGGLTVLKEILKNNSYDKIVYYGDTLRIPYGEKDKKTLISLARDDIAFLRSKGADEIVMACGTISSNALDEIKDNYDFKIMGILDVACKCAVETTKNNKIGVIATPATIKTEAFRNRIKALKNVDVYEEPCPDLVLLIESGETKGKKIDDVLDKYLHRLKDNGIDTLILGCTHYPILSDSINKYFDGKVNLINSGVLIQKELNNGRIIKPKIEFYVSGNVDDFKIKARRIIDLQEIDNVKN